jgi:hypothetical protein
MAKEVVMHVDDAAVASRSLIHGVTVFIIGVLTQYLVARADDFHGCWRRR